jgi:uncharacterized caspase-like protein
MARSLGIAIGINHYQDKSLKCLKYAKRDAEFIQDFLENSAKFEKVCIFYNELIDSSKPLTYSKDFRGSSTRPTRSNLRKFLREELPSMTPEDNFWFFFSGHGIRDAKRDYLMPEDGDPDDPDDPDGTGISLLWVVEKLISCNAGHIVLIVDACRQEGLSGQRGNNFGCDKYPGVTIIFSCEPNTASYEIDSPIKQGSFTYNLLKCFQKQREGKYLTVVETDKYLARHVQELNRTHHKPRQIPRIQVDPVELGQRILLPQYAEQMIRQLKNMATEAEKRGDLVTASQYWSQVLSQTTPDEPEYREALDACQRIGYRQSYHISFVKSKAGQAEEKSDFDMAIHLWTQVSKFAKRYNDQAVDQETFDAIQRISRKKAEKLARSTDINQEFDEDLERIAENISIEAIPPAPPLLEVDKASLDFSEIDQKLQSPPRIIISGNEIGGLYGTYLSYTLMGYISSSNLSTILFSSILIITALVGIFIGLQTNYKGEINRLIEINLGLIQLYSSFIALFILIIISVVAFWCLGFLLTLALFLCGSLSQYLTDLIKLTRNPSWINAFNWLTSVFNTSTNLLIKALAGVADWTWIYIQSLPEISIWLLVATLAIAAASSLTFNGETLRRRFFKKAHIAVVLSIITILGLSSGWGLYLFIFFSIKG